MAGQNNKIINAAVKKILAPKDFSEWGLPEDGLMITGIL